MTTKRPSNVRTVADAAGVRAAIYARISLDTVGEAAGVRGRIHGCHHLVKREVWSVDAVLVDNDLSAYSGACRPEYERLLDLVRRSEIDVIVPTIPTDSTDGSPRGALARPSGAGLETAHLRNPEAISHDHRVPS